MNYSSIITGLLYIFAIFNIAKSMYYLIKGDDTKEMKATIEAILCISVIALEGKGIF